MTITFYLVLSAILVLVIAALKKRLTFELQAFGLILFGNTRFGIYFYSIIFLPGTILHELSHWIVAEILQVRTGEMQVLPSLTDSGEKEERLGFVMTGRSDPIRTFFIGFAPFFTGTLTLVILGSLLNSFWGVAPWWQLALLVYGLIVVGQSMIVSRADTRNWPFMGIFLIALYWVSQQMGLVFTPVAEANIMAVLLRINQALGLTIGLNFAMIGGSYLIRLGLQKITKKRIVQGRKTS